MRTSLLYPKMYSFINDVLGPPSRESLSEEDDPLERESSNA